MFLGKGAEQLADKYNIEKVENDYFFTQKRYDDWLKARSDIFILLCIVQYSVALYHKCCVVLFSVVFKCS